MFYHLGFRGGADNGNVRNSSSRRHLQWDVYTPTTAGPWPAVVVIHGGGFKAGGKATPDLVVAAQDLADAGYLALSVTYQLAPPGSITGQTSTGQGMAQYEDIQMAVRAAKADLRCDGRVGAVGGSAGGTHATWVALTADVAGRVNVGVSLSGAYDSLTLAQIRTCQALGRM